MAKRRVVHTAQIDGEIEPSSRDRTFIEYNNLDHEERLFFAHSGLDRFIGIAGRLLAKRIGPVENVKTDQPYVSDNDLRTLNGLVGEVLELIGKHSNQRYGADPINQHRYFQRPSERNGFPVSLFIARWYEVNAQLVRKSKKHEKKIKENLSQIRGGLCSKKAFKGISAAKKVTFGKSRLTETETRAVGVFYMVNLVHKTLREGQIALDSGKAKTFDLSNALKSGFELFSLLDASDQMMSHSEGGKKGDKKRDYLEATKIAEEIVRADPDLSTNILASRALSRIDAECVEGEIPRRNWVLNKIRYFRKKV